MTESFTASNGREVVVTEDDEVRVSERACEGFAYQRHYDQAEFAALREYVLHLRDVELGRERVEGHSDYVVYPVGSVALVLDERTAECEGFEEHHAALETEISELAEVARDWFAQNDQKPARAWESAPIGEVWLLRCADSELPYMRMADGGWATAFVGQPEPAPKLSEFTAGRRIWPEP